MRPEIPRARLTPSHAHPPPLPRVAPPARTVPGRFPATETGGDTHDGVRLNHRIYGVSTPDLKLRPAGSLFYDGGFNAIDACIVRDPPRHVMFVKDETRHPAPRKEIRIATAQRAAGPYGPAGPPISPQWVEGPTAIRLGDRWYLYYDAYTRKRYEGARSRDLREWESISDDLSFPEGARHGTVSLVPEAIVRGLESPAH